MVKKTVCWWWNLFVNHHGQSGERQLWFAEPVLSSTALIAFIPSLSNRVHWKQGAKGTIYYRITDCAELEGIDAFRLLFFRVWLVILVPSSPSDGQLDTLSSFTPFSFYKIPCPLPFSPSWWCLLQLLLHTGWKLLWKYPSSPLPRGVKHNTKGKFNIFCILNSVTFCLLWPKFLSEKVCSEDEG